MYKNKFFRFLMALLMGVQFGIVPDDQGGGSDNTDDDKDKDTGADKDADKDTDKDADKDDKSKKPDVSDSEAKLLRELMSKKGALKTANTELADVKAQLAKFDDFDLEAVNAVLLERKNADDKRLEDKGEWNRLKLNLVEQHDTAVTGFTTQIETLKAELMSKTSEINKLTVGSKFDTSKYIDEELVLTPSKAQTIFGNHFDYEDGKLVGYDKPKGSAERTMLIDEQGNSLSFDSAMQAIVGADVDKESLIRSKLKPGANSDTNNGKVKIESQSEVGRSRITSALNASK